MTPAALLALHLAAAQDPASTPLDLPACLADPPACVKAAGADFKAGHAARAAAQFEALADARPDVRKYHYYAGLARETAGDDVPAYLHMRRFLAAPDAGTPADRRRAEQRIAAIATRTTRIDLRLPARDDLTALRLTRQGAPAVDIPLSILPVVEGRRTLLLTAGEWELAVVPASFPDTVIPPLRLQLPAGPGRRRVELTARQVRHELTLQIDPPAAAARGVTLRLEHPGVPPLEFTARTPTVRRQLLPGAWTLSATARRHQPLPPHTLVLAGPTTHRIQLHSKWTPDRRRRLRLGLALAGTGLATGVAGTVLLAVSEAGMNDILDRAGTIQTDIESGRVPDTDPIFERLPRLKRLGDTGSALLGTMTGLWVGTALLGGRQPSRKTRAGLATGLLVSAGGAIALGVTHDRLTAIARESYTTSDDPEENRLQTSVVEARYQPMIAAAVLGAGLGLLSAVLATLPVKKHRKSPLARRLPRLSLYPVTH